MTAKKKQLNEKIPALKKRIRELERINAGNKKENERLKQEKETIQRYMDITGTMLVALDTRGNIILTNNQSSKILGHKKEDLLGRNWFKFCVPEKERTRVKKVFEQLVSGNIKRVEYYENKVLTKDRKERTIAWHNTVLEDPEGGICGVLSSGLDVTERKKGEMELQKLASVVKYSSELINLATPEGQMIFLNDTGKKMLGIDPKKVMLTNIMDVIPERYVDTVKNKIIPGLLDGRVWKGELQYRNLKTGLLTDVNVMAFPIKETSSNRVVSFANISHDITERKKAGEKLKKAYKELKESHEMFIQAEKLAALGRFSSSVAHEIKNPLGVILGGTEYLENKLTDRDKKDIKKAINAIKHAVHRGNNMVHNLLAYSKQSETRFEKIRCSTLIRSEIDFIKYGFIKKKIKIDTDLEKDVYIEADKGQLQQVLFNVMINAVDAMGEKGHLTVKVQKKSLPEFSLSEPACIISISDNGIGISRRNLKKIFEPFFTSKKGNKKGTGLGLSAVKKILDNHNGKITIKSKPKKGTEVQIVLKALT